MGKDKKSPKLLIISQVYVPDPAAVGQYMHEAAVEMIRRGYPVRILTSSRGYEDSSVRYLSRETIEGVEIIRLPCPWFGKKSLLHRLLGQSSFLIQAMLRGLFTSKLGAVFISTSPPMVSSIALVIAAIRRVPIVYWVMDINPDQIITMQILKKESLLVRLFNCLNRWILNRAHTVITLDRFMAGRLRLKADISEKLVVFPPWPHEDHLEIISHDQNPFRKKHDWNGKFVVMYSGNHGLITPLSTIIQAAEQLQDRSDIVFVFIGGGVGKKDVEDAIERGIKNIISLPYQPLTELKYSLSAADVHLVSVADHIVGLSHACKVYGAMAVGRPILLFGPEQCHVSDILLGHHIGFHVNHGDVKEAVKIFMTLMEMSCDERDRMGQRARSLVRHIYSKHILCTRLGDLTEAALNRGTLLNVDYKHSEVQTG